jgi:rhodanese-related sulfurtransferase
MQRFPLAALLVAGLLLLFAAAGVAAEPAKTDPPASAALCAMCHTTAPDNLRGHWENVSWTASAVQMKIDSRMEVLRFDKAALKTQNTAEKGDLEKALRSIKPGAAIRVVFVEKGGVRYATEVVVKPPVKLADEDKIPLTEVQKLVEQGPVAGKYLLFDSRPAKLFKESAIPTAQSLPFPEFDKKVDLLPADKGTLVIFYCAGPACTMSPNSQARAKKLGYTNTKVFVGGLPEWSGKNYAVTTAKGFQEAYKDLAYVLLDARQPAVAEKGFAKGAVAFPSADNAALQGLPKKFPKAPILVYDEDGKGNSRAVASAIVKAGYTNTIVVSDGFAGMQQAGLPVETGKLASAVQYVPRLKPGEYPKEQFKKMLAAGIPADTVLLDVRSREEALDDAIKGVVNIPADDLEKEYGKLAKDKNIITLCNTGTRAEMAYHILKGKGFPKVAFLNATVEVDEGKMSIEE